MNKSQETINAEIILKLNEIHGDISEIKAQTTKTNGRVSLLENWRWLITGGLTVISVVIIPIAIKVLF